jgi:hypothetical protein
MYFHKERGKQTNNHEDESSLNGLHLVAAADGDDGDGKENINFAGTNKTACKLTLIPFYRREKIKAYTNPKI